MPVWMRLLRSVSAGCWGNATRSRCAWREAPGRTTAFRSLRSGSAGKHATRSSRLGSADSDVGGLGRHRQLEVNALEQCGSFVNAWLLFPLSGLRSLFVSSHWQTLSGVPSRRQPECPEFICIAEQPTPTGSRSSWSFIEFDLFFFG